MSVSMEVEHSKPITDYTMQPNTNTSSTTTSAAHRPSSRAQPSNNVFTSISSSQQSSTLQPQTQPLHISSNEFDPNILPRTQDGQLDIQTILQSNETYYFPILVCKLNCIICNIIQCSVLTYNLHQQ